MRKLSKVRNVIIARTIIIVKLSVTVEPDDVTDSTSDVDLHRLFSSNDLLNVRTTLIIYQLGCDAVQTLLFRFRCSQVKLLSSL